MLCSASAWRTISLSDRVDSFRVLGVVTLLARQELRDTESHSGEAALGSLLKGLALFSFHVVSIPDSRLAFQSHQ